jgi:hypothetical protein
MLSGPPAAAGSAIPGQCPGQRGEAARAAAQRVEGHVFVDLVGGLLKPYAEPDGRDACHTG